MWFFSLQWLCCLINCRSDFKYVCKRHERLYWVAKGNTSHSLGIKKISSMLYNNWERILLLVFFLIFKISVYFIHFNSLTFVDFIDPSVWTFWENVEVKLPCHLSDKIFFLCWKGGGNWEGDRKPTSCHLQRERNTHSRSPRNVRRKAQNDCGPQTFTQ